MIVRKFIKIIAIRYQTVRLKCTKIDFGWGSVPEGLGTAVSFPSGVWALDPAGELTALPQSPDWNKRDLHLREEEGAGGKLEESEGKAGK